MGPKTPLINLRNIPYQLNNRSQSSLDNRPIDRWKYRRLNLKTHEENYLKIEKEQKHYFCQF